MEFMEFSGRPAVAKHNRRGGYLPPLERVLKRRTSLVHLRLAQKNKLHPSNAREFLAQLATGVR